MSKARNLASGSGIEAGEVLPHIIPGVLYPAVAGKLLDGSTSHGSTYGVAQADGFSYYYTDIKGSKPIKDPRIGAHFGSQRHKIKSLQLLEQETATHGTNVYSLDGREWFRIATSSHILFNDSGGSGYIRVAGGTSNFYELTGYFIDANLIFYNNTSNRGFTTKVDGGSTSSENTTFETTVATPLSSRYVDAGALGNLGLGLTLGIHTLRISPHGGSDNVELYGIELIAQDTTSTANKSKIQIPSQNVVSYGKKFTVSGTPHYNPFAFKTDGTTPWTSGNHNGTAWPVGTGSSANIDTATSLGLAAWVSTNYYYPYNGGRVVWWVDSSGTLKCSVNMMPPNARNISSTASNEKGDDSAGTTSAAVANTQYLPTFTDQAIDHSQAEVAKTFHWREYGNGAANGGTGATYADTSMLSSTDDIAYVMDDGLTSLSGDDVFANAEIELKPWATNDYWYTTFIGTGITISLTQQLVGTFQIAQNLPYGTHILKCTRDADDTPDYIIDGVALNDVSGDTVGGVKEITIHQPKKPPIPEDAVVLADYMLMADFVAQGANGLDKISKGARIVHTTRDTLHDCTNGSVSINAPGAGLKMGMGMNYADFTSEQGPQLTYFGDAKVVGDFRYWGDAVTKIIHHFDGATTNVAVSSQYTDSGAETTSLPSAGGGGNYYIYATKSSGTMGVQTVKSLGDELGGTADDWLYHDAYQVATPIHTSSHYQTFETPYLHELVGGDRNMEQNNLIVTPDGKSWDEVTRDTSYIGNCVLRATTDTETAWSTAIVLDEWRGANNTFQAWFNKDFAINYKFIVCLRTGNYTFIYHSTANTLDGMARVAIQRAGTTYIIGYLNASDVNGQTDILHMSQNVDMQRGDIIDLHGEWGGYSGTGDADYLRNFFEIYRN